MTYDEQSHPITHVELSNTPEDAKWTRGQKDKNTERQKDNKPNRKYTDMEFVTKVTNDTCVRYFWAQENSRKITLHVKLAEFRQEFSQINWSEFVFVYIIAQ